MGTHTRHDWPDTRRLTYVLFDPVSGHSHNGVGACGGPIVAQRMVGSYAQLTTFTLAQANVWLESPAQVTANFAGHLVRCEYACALICATKGQTVEVGFMIDGAAPSVVVGLVDAPENGFSSMTSGTYYITPAAGTHRISIGLNGPAGSSVANTVAMTLYLTEQLL